MLYTNRTTCQVDNFQPFYAFNKRKGRDLHIGAEILNEALEREITKEERQERAKQQEKAVAAAQVANVSPVTITPCANSC